MNSNIAYRKHGTGIISVIWLVALPLVRAVDERRPDQKVNTATTAIRAT